MQTLLGVGSRVEHPEFGPGVIINLKSNGYTITYINHGVRVMRFDAPLTVIEAVEPDGDLVSLLDVEQALSRVLQKWADVTELVPLGDKWKGGKLILKPGRADLASKELPIDTFFHKIVMVRDRLRTLEQRVNASGLDDESKVNIQQYITRVYGSLTSFNVLFKHAEHQFIGDKSSADAMA
ncbi:hypothetical protein F5984_01920 [Rudanella paleaurantiibacter]|uniref:Uncharacterized protein n=1 Tax=Rudanella paleaurantiibacter TaxID=2614655 RepID=A0A7J5U4Z6_9BACT|nr:hypothetical protein [Rudanella paleaurantiibacter]KAB7732731.1 hypothetical protein F5984_01920 [Rudanella paleaurantiibacter]